MTTITLPRAVAEQALEALERARPLKADYTTPEYFEEAKRKHYTAMAALRAAMAQQAEQVDCDGCAEVCRRAVVCALCAGELTRLAQQAEPVGTRALIEECLAAFAQELAAWDIDPPLHHVKQAHDKCEAWLAAPPQQPEPVEQTCTWQQDGDSDSGVYGTSCGHYFQIEDGTPADNKMAWCCYCGKKLAQELITENEDD